MFSWLRMSLKYARGFDSKRVFWICTLGGKIITRLSIEKTKLHTTYIIIVIHSELHTTYIIIVIHSELHKIVGSKVVRWLNKVTNTCSFWDEPRRGTGHCADGWSKLIGYCDCHINIGIRSVCDHIVFFCLQTYALVS